MDGDRILTLDEACDFLKVTSNQMYKLVQQEKIRYRKFGEKRIRFLLSDLRRYLNE